MASIFNALRFHVKDRLTVDGILRVKFNVDFTDATVTNLGTISGATFTAGTFSGVTITGSAISGGTYTGATQVTSTQVVAGNSAAVTIGSVSTWPLQVFTSGSTNDNAVLANYRANAVGPTLRFFKSRGTTVGADGLLSDGDSMLRILAYGADGAAGEVLAGTININVDGTPSAGDIPGRIVFATRQAGGGVTEVLRLTAASNYLFGGTASAASAAKALHLFNGTAPSAGVANGAVMYAEDVSSSSVMKIMNESGDVIILDQQAALTAADAGTVNTGDATSDGVINNIRTRFGELETKLTTMGILAA